MIPGRRRGNRSFGLLWFAQSVDELGSTMVDVVLASLAILVLHAGPLQIAVMLAVRYTVMPVVGIVSVPVIARHSLRSLMQYSHLLRGASLASVPVAALLHVVSMWQIYAVVALDGACATIFAIAYESAVPRLVSQEQLVQANSRLSATSAVGAVAGPGAGGISAQLFGPALTLWANVVSFFITALALFGMTDRVVVPSDGPGGGAESRVGPTRREAWTMWRHNRMLRGVTMSRMACNVGGGMIEANLLVFMYSSGQLPGTVGIILALGEIGAFLGVFLAGRISRAMAVGTRLVVVPVVIGLFYMLLPASISTANAACDQAITRGHAAGSINYPATEVQPMVADDPTRPRHLIVTAQQDRWSDGGSNAVNSFVSDDGGLTWALAQGQPRSSICSGATPGTAGYFDRSSDSWVSIGPDGVAYESALAFNLGGPGFGGSSGVTATTSTDGGHHWKQPVSVINDPSALVLNDKDTVMADPMTAGRAYIVWDRLSFSSYDLYKNDGNSDQGPAMFSMTSDGGATWTRPRAIFDPGPRAQTFDNVIMVEPTGPNRGMLVDAFLLDRNPGTPKGPTVTHLAAVTSSDGGATWSSPHIIGLLPVGPPDPNNAQEGFLTPDVMLKELGGTKGVHADIFPNFAINPVDGAIYATWQELGFTPGRASKVAVSGSTDGGVHWTAPFRVDHSPGEAPTFLPQIHVAQDGTIGVLNYDLRNATTSHPGLTDVYLERCASSGKDCTKSENWSETRVTTTGSFDITVTINVYDQYYVGDYMALTNDGTAFVALYTVTSPLALKGPDEVFSNRIK